MLYDRPVYALMSDAAKELVSPYTPDDIVAWFAQRYPAVKDATVRLHVIGLTANDRNRRHHRRLASKTPLFYCRVDGTLEPFDPDTHAGPYEWESVGHDDERHLGEIATLLSERNRVDERIAAIIRRPMTAGHLGEWIASQVFDIELERSAVAAAIDGRFRSGPLQGCTVNVKWYLKREGLLDTTDNPALDYYLVLTGPPAAAQSSRGGTRPWCIENVYLFEATRLRAEQAARGIKSGVAASVRNAQWVAAEISPAGTNPALRLSARQRELLRLFAQRV